MEILIFGPWEWGGTMNFHEIIQNSKNGELRIKAIPEVLDYFSKEIELKKETLYNCKMVRRRMESALKVIRWGLFYIL